MTPLETGSPFLSLLSSSLLSPRILAGILRRVRGCTGVGERNNIRASRILWLQLILIPRRWTSHAYALVARECRSMLRSFYFVQLFQTRDRPSSFKLRWNCRQNTYLYKRPELGQNRDERKNLLISGITRSSISDSYGCIVKSENAHIYFTCFAYNVRTKMNERISDYRAYRSFEAFV